MCLLDTPAGRLCSLAFPIFTPNCQPLCYCSIVAESIIITNHFRRRNGENFTHLHRTIARPHKLTNTLINFIYLRSSATLLLYCCKNKLYASHWFFRLSITDDSCMQLLLIIAMHRWIKNPQSLTLTNPFTGYNLSYAGCIISSLTIFNQSIGGKLSPTKLPTN